jgi:hypothetical protein
MRTIVDKTKGHSIQISSPFVTGMHENGDYIAINTSSCITNADLIDPHCK